MIKFYPAKFKDRILIIILIITEWKLFIDGSKEYIKKGRVRSKVAMQ